MSNDTKASRVHQLVNAGDYPGMSEAFDAHMGAACWVDPAYRPDAATWAAAWKAAVAAERERLCAAIKAADDKASENDYMLDSDDCIRVIRGTWNPNA